ncbi:MAG TPA: zinc-ribbon domain-containing protein [Planctomycetaceae bacterium]|nr:zinc-ribbon domain-containing protein [Planctomycetaceae bacterium]
MDWIVHAWADGNNHPGLGTWFSHRTGVARIVGLRRRPSSNANLTTCPDCGNQVSLNAASCPKCGSPLTKK